MGIIFLSLLGNFTSKPVHFLLIIHRHRHRAIMKEAVLDDLRSHHQPGSNSQLSALESFKAEPDCNSFLVGSERVGGGGPKR